MTGLPEASWKELVRPRQGKGKGKKRRERRDKVKPEIVKERGFKTLTLEREEIAEIDYRPSKAKRTYRMVMLRKTILVEKGQKRLLPQRRYHFYVTNIPAAELGTAGVVRENNQRCNQENVIEQLKNGVEALRMPSDTLVAKLGLSVDCGAGLESEGLDGAGAAGATAGQTTGEDGISPFPARDH